MLNRLGSVLVLLLGSATGAMASTPVQVPEPGSLALLASGVGGALLYARHRMRLK